MSPRKFFKWVLVAAASFLVLFVVVPFVLLAFIYSVADTLKGKPVVSDKRVAVIELDGTIMTSKKVLEQLYKQAGDPTVKGIVVRVNSPGGAVGPAQEIYSAIKKLKKKKPIIASMGTVAASGGLYSVLSATKILAQPGTMTGSVGVIVQIPNFSRIMNTVGVEVLTIKSGELKDAGNMFRAATEKEKTFLQSTVNVAYQEFVHAIAESRKLEESEIKKWADGRVILGSQAVAYGLIDGYGDVHDASRSVFEELGTPLKDTESPELIYPMESKFKYLRELLDSMSFISNLFQTRHLEVEYLMM